MGDSFIAVNFIAIRITTRRTQKIITSNRVFDAKC